MAGYKVRAAALADLDAIATFIQQDNPERAATFVNEIIGRFAVIAERPLSFPASSDLPAEVRSSLHGRYRILFEVVDGTAQILRVIHGARDIGNLLR